MSAQSSRFTRPGKRDRDPAGPARHVQRFTVSYEYEVRFTWDALDPGDRSLVEAVAAAGEGRRHRLLVVIDDGVADAWPDLAPRILQYAHRHADCLELAAPPEVVPGGERCKNDRALVDRLHARIHALGIDRHSFVVAVGGGAVQDAAGFAAATAHRGVRLVRLPTTVLAQNDSGVGVKNAINAFGSKNFVGTFTPPHAVINASRFLETLPRRDRIAGLAEAVKVALLRDEAFFRWLEDHADELVDFDPGAVAVMIRRSAYLHMQHIATSGDPFELGSGRPLDFGHWAAHKLEMLSGNELRHGEAVAIGIALDARQSFERGWLDGESLERICSLFQRLGLPLWHEAFRLRDDRGRPRVWAGLEEFREHLGGELTLTLLHGPGRAVETTDIDERAVERSIAWLATRRQR